MINPTRSLQAKSFEIPSSALTGLAAALCLAIAPAAFGEEKDGWIQLFNGKDLTGWTPKFTGYELGENPGNTFRVEDGILMVRYDDAELYPRWGGQFGHLFYKDEFSDYLLRVEYRFVGEQIPGGPGWAFRNNGIMIHGQPAETMTKDQDFPVSLEVQLLGGDGNNERPTANLCTPGTHVVYQGELDRRHCINSTSKTFHGDQWVTVEIEVRGGKVIRHKIDGETVIEYTGMVLDPNHEHAKKEIERRGTQEVASGTISLQAESHPTDFRRIELLPLVPEE